MAETNNELLQSILEELRAQRADDARNNRSQQREEREYKRPKVSAGFSKALGGAGAAVAKTVDKGTGGLLGGLGDIGLKGFLAIGALAAALGPVLQALKGFDPQKLADGIDSLNKAITSALDFVLDNPDMAAAAGKGLKNVPKYLKKPPAPRPAASPPKGQSSTPSTPGAVKPPSVTPQNPLVRAPAGGYTHGGKTYPGGSVMNRAASDAFNAARGVSSAAAGSSGPTVVQKLAEGVGDYAKRAGEFMKTSAGKGLGKVARIIGVPLSKIATPVAGFFQAMDNYEKNGDAKRAATVFAGSMAGIGLGAWGGGLLGSAIGAASPIPGGALIGGIAGSILGGMAGSEVGAGAADAGYDLATGEKKSAASNFSMFSPDSRSANPVQPASTNNTSGVYAQRIADAATASIMPQGGGTTNTSVVAPTTVSNVTNNTISNSASNRIGQSWLNTMMPTGNMMQPVLRY